MHLNIQGYEGKENFLELLVEESSATVLCLTETWLTMKTVYDACLQGYDAVGYYRRCDHIRGGVAVFVKSGAASEVRFLDFGRAHSVEIHFESVTVEFKRAICIVAVYRSTDGNFKIFCRQLSLLLNCLVPKYKQLILCGDLNVNRLKPGNKETRQLQDLFRSYQLLSLVDKPTRIFGGSQSVIDYIVTNVNNNIHWKIVDFPASDHNAQVLTWDTFESERPSVYINVRSTAACNLEEFRYLFNRDCLDLQLEVDDIDTVFNTFWDHFLHCFNVACPQRRVKVKSPCEKLYFRYDTNLKEMHENLRLLGHINNVLNDEQFRMRFKEFRRQFNCSVRKSKREYYSRLISASANKTRKLWEIVRFRTGRVRTRDEISLKIGDHVIVNRKLVADELARHFSTEVKDRLRQLYGDGRGTGCTTEAMRSVSLFFPPIQVSEMLTIVLRLKNHTAPGIDEVSAGVVKCCASEVAFYLTAVVNRAVTLGQYPSVLKRSLVVPIYKKGDPCSAENYRQVALASVFSKIMERSIYEKIWDYLEKHNILHPSQHGFRSGHSTETATCEFVQHVADEVDKNKFVAGIFFDLSRAFDTIDLSYLSEKIHCLGIRGPVNRLLVSFASERQIIVKNRDVLSESCDIDVGTPQGSVLGPLLFILYVNDLARYISGARIFMYADDTSIVVSADTYEGLLMAVGSVLNQFDSWCERNRLLINYSKTVAVEFSGMYKIPHDGLTFSVSGNRIETVDSVTFLGTVLDRRMDWSAHISSVCTKLGRAFYAMLTIRNSVDDEALLQIYYATVQSILSYNLVVWGQAAELHRVFVLQKRILRMMFRMEPRQTCREVFKDKGIMTVVSLYLYKLLLYIHKNKNRFTLNSDVHDYSTRNAQSIRLQQIGHLNHRKTPEYSGCFIFNKLPREWKNLGAAAFKNRIKRIFKYNVFYSIEEFYGHLDSGGSAAL